MFSSHTIVIIDMMERLSDPTVILPQYNTYQIIMLHTLNLHNVVCQLYLSRLGKKKTKDLGLGLK